MTIVDFEAHQRGNGHVPACPNYRVADPATVVDDIELCEHCESAPAEKGDHLCGACRVALTR